MDYNFTAGLEEELDQVSRGEKQWKPLLKEFWEPFIALLKQKEGEVKKSDLTTEATDETCPECGKPLVVKLGKRGKFIACSGFQGRVQVHPQRRSGGWRGRRAGPLR